MTALVIDGHPNSESLCAALARSYADGHGNTRILALRDLDFDVHMRWGYTRRQELEPDLIDAWQAILAADHVIVVAPIWWGSVPALLKGFFDRLLLPRRAYRYRDSGLPEGLLRGRTGRLILTTDSPWWYLALTGNTAVRQVRNMTMRFCGIRTARATVLGPVKASRPGQRNGWIQQVGQLARREAAAGKGQAAPAIVPSRTLTSAQS